MLNGIAGTTAVPASKLARVVAKLAVRVRLLFALRWVLLGPCHDIVASVLEVSLCRAIEVESLYAKPFFEESYDRPTDAYSRSGDALPLKHLIRPMILMLHTLRSPRCSLQTSQVSSSDYSRRIMCRASIHSGDHHTEV